LKLKHRVLSILLKPERPFLKNQKSFLKNGVLYQILRKKDVSSLSKYQKDVF